MVAFEVQLGLHDQASDFHESTTTMQQEYIGWSYVNGAIVAKACNKLKTLCTTWEIVEYEFWVSGFAGEISE